MTFLKSKRAAGHSQNDFIPAEQLAAIKEGYIAEIHIMPQVRVDMAERLTHASQETLAALREFFAGCSIRFLVMKPTSWREGAVHSPIVDLLVEGDGERACSHKE